MGVASLCSTRIKSVLSTCRIIGMSEPKLVSQQQLASLVEPGESVYVAGGLLPPVAFMESLYQDPQRTANMQFGTSVIPGFPNAFDFSRLHPTAVVSSVLSHPAFTKEQREGRFRVLPLTFTGYLRYLETQTYDVGVVQVAPPDRDGRYSLSQSVEFTPAAMARCRRLIAVVNPNMRPLPYSVSIAADALMAVCEEASEIPSYGNETDEATEAIGRLIAQFIEDGSVLQTGLGKVPGAIARALRGHRNLAIHSGMVSDGLMELALAGALDPDATHYSTVVAGSKELYDWMPEARGLQLVGCDQTHAPATLARLEKFVAVNSALEVDLLGQCNLEHRDGRAISGAGAAPDFAATARNCRGGLSIVALNATYDGGTKSRIVPALPQSAVASLSRVDVDLVITEFGVADLRLASVHERARALINVAAPQFRESLEREWAERARRL